MFWANPEWVDYDSGINGKDVMKYLLFLSIMFLVLGSVIIYSSI